MGYHDKTLQLLEDPVTNYCTQAIEERAKQFNIQLPKAFLEWAAVDGASILSRFSNCDIFEFDNFEVVELEIGEQAIVYHLENQSNFSKAILLNGSEDPPVLYSWCGDPWVTESDKFSDSIYAHIFDWQYWLDDGEFFYTADIVLKNDSCLKYLQKNYTEDVTTSYEVDESLNKQCRFYRSLKERVTVSVNEAKKGSYIHITGDQELVLKSERELLAQFQDLVIPESFSAYIMVCNHIVWKIENGYLDLLKYSFLEPPSDAELEALRKCHESLSLKARIENTHFPQTQEDIMIGDEDWGVIIHLKNKSVNWWWLKCIELI